MYIGNQRLTPVIPTGDSSMTILQTTGDSETAAMSQKATTDELNLIKYGYCGDDLLIIPDETTEIEEGVVLSETDYKCVIIPNTVTTIGDYVFADMAIEAINLTAFTNGSFPNLNEYTFGEDEAAIYAGKILVTTGRKQELWNAWSNWLNDESQIVEMVSTDADVRSIIKEEIGDIGNIPEMDDLKAEIVQEIIRELQGLPVFGVVDENNIITVTSQLSDGTYTLKYENADGTTTEIGTITVGTGTGDGSGGDDSGETEEPDTPTVSYTNQIPLSVNSDDSEYVGDNGEDGYKTGYRVNSSGVEAAQDGMCCTGFIPYSGETIRLKNVTIASESGKTDYIAVYNPDKSFNQVVQLSVTLTDDGSGVLTGISTAPSQNSWIRITCGVIDDTSILTLDEEIV